MIAKVSRLLQSIASILVLGLGLVGFVHAEKADQDKPIILEAEKVLVNDVSKFMISMVKY